MLSSLGETSCPLPGLTVISLGSNKVTTAPSQLCLLHRCCAVLPATLGAKPWRWRGQPVKQHQTLCAKQQRSCPQHCSAAIERFSPASYPSPQGLGALGKGGLVLAPVAPALPRIGAWQTRKGATLEQSQVHSRGTFLQRALSPGMIGETSALTAGTCGKEALGVVAPWFPSCLAFGAPE